jgi:hypothetical protein
VNHNTKRYRTVSDQNGVQTKTLVGKHNEQKSQISEDKKGERDDALLITSQHDGIYLEPGRNKYYQEAARKKENIYIIQTRVQELIRKASNHK